MFFWIIIFIIVVLISFLLSYLSMKDYQPPLDSKKDYGLFLIRKNASLSLDLLSQLLENLDSNLISFERLFRGGESALLIYGPKVKLAKFQSDLDLLEMEDYTLGINLDSIYAWEFGLRADLEDLENFFEDFPKLSQSEQFWWQIIIKPIKKVGKIYQGNIRAVLWSANSHLTNQLVKTLQNLAPKYLIKLPKAYSNKQIINFYLERNMNSTKQNLNPRQILKLLKIN